MITSCTTLGADIGSGKMNDYFEALYGQDIDVQKQRYLRLLDLFCRDMPGADAMFVNAPGRTELGGNHTDHNHGCVLAAAVDLDCVAVITPVEGPKITLISQDYPEPIKVDLRDLELRPEEQGKPQALVRGMAAAFTKRTGCSCGFYGRLHATCLPGTGLSSSAAFSVLVGASLNFLFHNNTLSAEILAVMAREAENDFFGKPCGLMDQMASGVGRTIFVDFQEPEKPVVKRIDHTLEGTGYRLAIIDTGGSHVELTHEYAAIPEEMRAAAEVLGQPFGRGVSYEELVSSIAEIRRLAGDRAVLRLLHFIEENERAQTMAGLLQGGRFSEYLQCVKASGTSSCLLLQNCASAASSREQGILLALAMSRRICPLSVCRVHGGGFAGTVQVYVPVEEFENYSRSMERIFGTGSVIPVRIGRPGVCGLNGRGLVLPRSN
jgi:galactokinase